MSDYTPIISDYTAKDSLSVGDPAKLILGASLDAEYAAIQTAIASKYDVTDIATQAQAEAGTSNSVLMTPLRTAQLLADAGGGGAGVVNDLLGLTDPDDDRIVFWDDSAGAAAWLDLGTGLTISGTTISSDDTAIDHDSLSNFVANEHIDHTSVTITAGTGLQYSSGGTDISASATLALDINGLTTESVLAVATDYVPFYDASAGAERKVVISQLIGTELGDGKWYLGSTQALSAATEATIVYDTADYDSLQRGTFSLVTGEYTVGAAAIRATVMAQVTTQAQNDDSSLEIEVQVEGVTKLREYVYIDADNDTPETVLSIAGNLSLAAADVVRVRVTSSSAETADSGTEKSSFSIVELS